MTRARTELRHVGQQLLAHFVDPGQLELRLWARTGWRQKIQPNDRVEIWHGMTLIGQLSGDAMHSLVTHHLAGAALGAHLLEQLATRRTPRKIDPDAGGDIPLPIEPAMLSPQSIKRDARAARKREKAGDKARCGVFVPETGRTCGNKVPCIFHHPKEGGSR